MTLRAFIMEDSILEDKETFRLVLSSTQENVTVVSLPLTITIIDNECKFTLPLITHICRCLCSSTAGTVFSCTYV